jgi:hypothetical protein
MGSQGGDLHPFSNRDVRRGRREHALGRPFEAAYVDVKLVLGPDDGGVDNECDVVALRRPSVRALENRSTRQAALK